MKKQIISIILITLVMLPASLLAQNKYKEAQSEFNTLYEMYAGKDGFTSINISPDMFKFLGAIDMNDSSEDAKDTQDIMQQLVGLKMLVYSKPEGSSGSDFYKDVNKTITVKDYTELMTVNDKDSDIRFLVKKSGKDKISELLMIVKGEDEVLVMSMVGDIDMNTISDLSNSLNMKGMEHLEKIND